MSNEKWCKIFETEEHGQILIVKEQDDNDHLCVKTTFNCSMGWISFSVSIKPSDTEEDSQNLLFDGMDKESASAGVLKIKEEFGI